MTGYAETTLVNSMRYLSESQAAIAHNLANVNSTGFKRRIATAVPQDAFAQMLHRDMPTVRYGEQTDWSGGTVMPTGDKLHVALQSEGYFMVENAAGQRFYTRNGAMKLDARGNAVNGAGHHFLDSVGQRIQLDARSFDTQTDLQIKQDGSITINGQPVAKLGVFEVAAPQRLLPAGTSLYLDTAAVPGDRLTPSSTPRVTQGHLEQSNVDTMSELVQMLSVQRSFQASSRALSTVGRIETSFITAMSR